MAEALPGVDPRASCSPSCELDQELAVPIGVGFPPARDGGSLGGALERLLLSAGLAGGP
jgi:hypothetical protein